MSTESERDDFRWVRQFIRGIGAVSDQDALEAFDAIESRYHELEARLAEAEQRAAALETENLRLQDVIVGEMADRNIALSNWVARYEKILRTSVREMTEFINRWDGTTEAPYDLYVLRDKLRAALADTPPSDHLL